jgi:uncharacterized protein (TIGR00159 family)
MIGNFSVSLISFIQKTEFGFRHVLDFIVIFVLVFLLVSLIKKTRATIILIGIISLSLVYFFSITLNLATTKAVLQSFFSAFLIIFTILFQRELRRFFGFLGSVATGGKIQPPSDSSLKAIIRATQKMADNKTGALIVFPGQENIERLLEGGIKLNGHISYQLIQSIFDSTSPGHDGALVISKDLVRRFGVHLPLSENPEASKNLGTRHRAALGLAESSDALCIVVSEEKGTISIAHNKKLFAIKSEEELEKILQRFTDRISPTLNLGTFQRWLVKNAKTLTYSLLITIVVWVFFTVQNS